MGTVKLVPPDDVHGNARAVIVDRGSEAEEYWRGQGLVTEEEVAGTGATPSRVDVPKLARELQSEKQDGLSQGDGQEEAMHVHAKQQERESEDRHRHETTVEKGEGAPGIVGPSGSSPEKLSPDVHPAAPDSRPHVGRTALGVPTKPPDVATGKGEQLGKPQEKATERTTEKPMEKRKDR